MSAGAALDTEPIPGGPARAQRPGGTARLAALAVAVVLLLTAGGAIGWAAGRTRPPGDGSPEAGFARDMQTHHAQAVQMAMLIRDRSSDPTIRAVGYDIALGQQQQQGQMFGWLTQWGLPQATTRPPMAWMTDGGRMQTGATHADMAMPTGGRMPGMASAADIERLTRLRGRPAEVLGLQLMIAHHQGGIAMARAVLAMTDRPVVRDLAQNVVTNQGVEITQLRQLLDRRRSAGG